MRSDLYTLAVLNGVGAVVFFAFMIYAVGFLKLHAVDTFRELQTYEAVNLEKLKTIPRWSELPGDDFSKAQRYFSGHTGLILTISKVISAAFLVNSMWLFHLGRKSKNFRSQPDA